MIKEKDFVEIDFNAYTDDGELFDTSFPEQAKKFDLGEKEAKPLIICIGKDFAVSGLEKGLIGKEVGKDYVFKLQPEEAFGKKDVKKIKIINTNQFLKEEIKPFPGLIVSIDGIQALVRSVSGGRTVIDYNPPLAGREVKYEVNVLRIVSDVKEKLKSFIITRLRFPEDMFTIEINGANAVVKTEFEFPKDILVPLMQEILETILELKDIKFEKVSKPAVPIKPGKTAETLDKKTDLN